MLNHLYLGYGFALCGTHIDTDNIINKTDGGITFNCSENQCQKCADIFSPTAQWLLNKMLGK